MTRWMNTMLMTLLVAAGSLMMPARASAGCTTALLDCYAEAAKIESFWYRTAAGLDCEIEYAGCVREALLSE